MHAYVWIPKFPAIARSICGTVEHLGRTYYIKDARLLLRSGSPVDINILPFLPTNSKNFQNIHMAVIKCIFVSILTLACISGTARAYTQIGMERMPLGGSLFILDRRDIAKRQDGNTDLDTPCGEDSACSPTEYGCECHFADESWIDFSEDPPAEVAEPEEPAESPPPTQIGPIDPPGNLQCQPSPTGNIIDSHSDKVSVAAKGFCSEFASSKDQDPAKMPISKTISAEESSSGLFRTSGAAEWEDKGYSREDVYDITISLVEGCVTEGDLNVAKPVKDGECWEILKSAWKQCNNKGRGGSLLAGCLTYSIVTKF